jgi:hypothetical protein
MKPISILGLGLQSGYRNVTSQERINCYLEFQKDGEKTNVVAYGTPGKSLFANAGVNPIRGAYSVNDLAYIVYDNGFYTMNNAGTITLVGTIGTSSGSVFMVSNGFEIFIADGTANAYYYTIATGILAVSNSLAMVSCDFMDGRIIGNEKDTGRYYISGSYQASTWNALDFATAESSPDNLVRVFSNNGGVMLFGQFTTEIVASNGAQDFPFGRIGYPVDWGLYALNSVAKLGDAVAFLGRNRMGEAQVVLMQGYGATRISTHDIERIINDSTILEAATGFSFMTNGHQMYQLTAGGNTFMYDLTTGVWSTLKSYGIERDKGERAINLINKILITDYANGNIYRVSDTVYDDNGSPLVMEISGKHVFYGDDKFSVSELFIDMETGVGLATGQGSNPQIMLQTSRDGGHTFGNEQWKTFGRVGEYVRVAWSRLGRSRDFVFRLVISDPVKRCIIGAWISAV